MRRAAGGGGGGRKHRARAGKSGRADDGVDPAGGVLLVVKYRFNFKIQFQNCLSIFFNFKLSF
jgi:hypothetical protein